MPQLSSTPGTLEYLVPGRIAVVYMRCVSLPPTIGTQFVPFNATTVRIVPRFVRMCDQPPARVRCSYDEQVTAYDGIKTVQATFSVMFYHPIRVLPRRSAAAGTVIAEYGPQTWYVLYANERDALPAEITRCASLRPVLESRFRDPWKSNV
jgi:hypothetical protein